MQSVRPPENVLIRYCARFFMLFSTVYDLRANLTANNGEQFLSSANTPNLSRTIADISY